MAVSPLGRVAPRLLRKDRLSPCGEAGHSGLHMGGPDGGCVSSSRRQRS